MFSCIKFKEHGKKRIMTVPSNWIVGESLCWPQNSQNVGLLFKKQANPQENWKRIQISKNLFQGITFW